MTAVSVTSGEDNEGIVDPEIDLIPGNGTWATLEQAFAAHGFPPENLSLVRRLTDAIGIDHYEGIRSRTYIKGIRRGEGRTLYIASGYTGGFDSEEEILDAVGDIAREPSEDGRHWWMHHPVNKIRDADGPIHPANRDHGMCASCFVVLPASGVCDECGA